MDTNYPQFSIPPYKFLLQVATEGGPYHYHRDKDTWYDTLISLYPACNHDYSTLSGEFRVAYHYAETVAQRKNLSIMVRVIDPLLSVEFERQIVDEGNAYKQLKKT